MIIYNFYVVCIAFLPFKTDPPLLVDTNAVLAGTVAFECLKPIAGRYLQIIQATGNLELSQFPSRDRFYVHEPSHADAF